MKAIYQNRMGDNIQFEVISENEIKMTGIDGGYRVGYNSDESLNFVDPFGGPFINIGTDMNRYFDGQFKKEVKIVSINKNETGEVILKVE